MSAVLRLCSRSVLRSNPLGVRNPALASQSYRFYSEKTNYKQAEQPRLRINSKAPNFDADTSHGSINLYDYLGNSWGILFSHPADFTPVCTTEMGAFAKLKPEFDKRNVKLLGLSVEDAESHRKWIKDIEEVNGIDKFGFPIIADTKRNVAFLYDMCDEEGFGNINDGSLVTVRSVFVIDPEKKIRVIFTYPSQVGRNTSEVLRVVDALQAADKNGVVTGANWTPQDDVIIPPKISDEDAKQKFGDFKTVKSYLRYTKL